MPYLLRTLVNHLFYGGHIGSLATMPCKPCQVRKEAAVAVDSGAEVSLMGPPPKLNLSRLPPYYIHRIASTLTAMAYLWKFNAYRVMLRAATIALI